jgi:hypothetical protein
MVFVICVNIFLTNHRGTEDAEEEEIYVNQYSSNHG